MPRLSSVLQTASPRHGVRSVITAFPHAAKVTSRAYKLFPSSTAISANAVIVLYVDTVIGVSRPRDGGWSSLNRGVLI
jgi:hypothetical protein